MAKAGKRAAPDAPGGPAGKKAKSGDAVASSAAQEVCNTQVSQHIVRVHNALKTIQGHDLFKNADSLSPLSIAEGGSQAPFNQKDCTNVLTQQQSLPANQRTGYKCGMNGFWPNHTWLVNPRVPILNSQVTYLMNKSYKFDDPPATAPHQWHLACDNPQFNVAEHFGSLQRISPEEIGQVLLFSTEEGDH